MLLLGQALIFAQIDVSGTVTDQTGLGLPAVNISIQGTTTGDITDLDGHYSITVPDGNAILVFSYIGYLKQEIGVGNQTEINVILQEDVLGLEEVVVIGYGTQRKMDVTGSVATMSGEEINAIPTPNFEEGMQGKIPGMEMKKTSAEPGGGISVKIRGSNSIMGNNEPLYVIDGFPLTNDNQSRPGGWELQKPLNLLSNLNASDIESVQVLKDASATAIYGSRGANGVIIITTKKGQAGKAMIDFEYSHSWSKAEAPFALCNVEDYARIENENIANNNGVDFRYTADNNYGLENATPAELGAKYGDGTDWLNEVLQTGQVDNYNLAISGGDAKTTYMISGNYYNETGVVLTSKYQRGTVRANVNSQVSKKLSVGMNMSGSRYVSDRFSQSGRITGGGPDRLGVIVEAFRANPMTQLDTPHLEPNDLLQHQPGQGNTTNFVYHPVKQVQNVDNEDKMNFFIGSAHMDYNILDDLKIVFRGGFNVQSQERINFQPFSVPVGAWYSGIGSHNFYDSRQYVYENYMNYTKTWGDHSLDVTLGYSIEYHRVQSKAMNGSGFNFDIQRIYGWSQLAVPGPMSIGESQRTLASVYGRAFYNFKDRYLVTFTARQDGSSVFAENNKSAFFPSIAAGWVLSEESFLSGADWLSNLKLRGSYGITGNQAISPYQSMARLGGESYVINMSKVSGLSPVSPANPDLIWESTKQVNIGIDATFLANRLRFGVDFYKKNTIDLLQNKPVLASTGYETYTTNFGEIANTGFEILIGGTILPGTFQWSSNITGSINRGEILDLGTAADGTPLTRALPPFSNVFHHTEVTMFVVGEPIGTFWGYDYLGPLSQEDVDNGVAVVPGLDEPGDMSFKDQITVDTDGDGIPDATDGQITPDDMGVIGNSEPDFIFGWDNTFTYKNWSLNVFVNAVIGSEIMNLQKIYTSMGNVRNGGGHHSKEYAENYWTPENTDTEFPRPGGGSSAHSTFLLESGTFVRISTASLNYMIPVNKLGWTWIKNATVYARGTNLFVFTNYSGFDPEGSYNGQSHANANIDLGNYPRPRSVELGVKLGF